MAVEAVTEECSACPRLQNSDDGCCSIYAHRPDICITFNCGWLAGALGTLDRPDRCGIIFVTAFNWCDDGVTKDTGCVDVDGNPVPGAFDEIPMVALMEAWPGAAEGHAGEEVIAALSELALVTVMHSDGQRQLRSANKEWVQRARDYAIEFVEQQVAAREAEAT